MQLRSKNFFVVRPGETAARECMTKILVIEDEEILRETILNILNSRDYSAIGAVNGRQGLQLAKQSLPDLILCDIRMPEFDGYEVLRALRQDLDTAAIPVIFLTAETEKNVASQGQRLGSNGYLLKPFTTAELLEAIERGLSQGTGE